MLETDRLILRQPVAEDFEPFAAMFDEPFVTAHIGGVLSRSEAWTRFLRDVGHWTLAGFGQFVIDEKEANSFVGKVGIAKFERDLRSNAYIPLECTWTLRSAFHGLALAKEAAVMVHQWHDARGGGPTACLIAKTNTPSLRLAAALGYSEVDRLQRPNGLAAVFMRYR